MSVFCHRAISDTRVIYGRRAESSQHSRIVMMLPSVTLSQINRAISRGEPERSQKRRSKCMHPPLSPRARFASTFHIGTFLIDLA